MNGWRKYLKTLHDEKINEFVRTSRVKNTVKKTKSDLRRWRDWCTTAGEKHNILDIPTKELNKLLCHFSVKATSRSGKEYEPDTLTCRQAPTLHDHVL